MSEPEDNRRGRAEIAVDEAISAPVSHAAHSIARRPARVIDGDLARLIAEGKIGTADVLGLTEEDVLAGIGASDEVAVAQIEDYLRKDNAQSRRGGEYKAWEAKYPAWAAWRNELTAIKSRPAAAGALKQKVEREARARKRAELVRDAETYLRDKHLAWEEHQKMLQLARELGLLEADVEWAYADVKQRTGTSFTRSGPPSPPSPLVVAGAVPAAPVIATNVAAPPSSRRAVASFDWVTALHGIEQRIGLGRIDEGIEGVANVRRDQLAAGRAHMAVAQQRMGIEQRLPALRNQEIALQHEERRARVMQHGPALMQVQGQQQRLAYERHQLETQHQHLGVELQRLDVEVQREERDAVENELLRMFVDVHDLVKSAFHAGRSADAFLLIIISERVYAQVYRWAQNPHNRMTLSGIRDANAASLATLMGSEVARRAILDCFVGGTAPYVDLLKRERAAGAALAATLAEFPANARVFLDGNALTNAIGQTRAYAEQLARCRHSLGSILEERRRHADDRYLNELLLVPCGTVLPDILRRFNDEVAEVRAGLETAIGEPLAAFGHAALTLDSRLSAHIAECTRVLGLLDLVTARQYFVGALPPLFAWQRAVAESLAQLQATSGSLAPPQGASRADIETYLAIAVHLARARECVRLVQTGTERNRGLADPQFVQAIPTFFQICHPEPDVVPWCQGVAHRFGVLRGIAQEVLDRALQLARAASDWKTNTLATEQPCDALVEEIASFMAPGMDEAIATEVRVKLSTLGGKLVTALTTAKSAERKQRQAYLEIALQKLSDAALAPLPYYEPPVVTIPV